MTGNKLIKHIAISILGVALCFNLQAQSQGLIDGFVKEKDGNAIPFANVIVKGTSLGTATNNQGFYQLPIPANTKLTIIYSSVGFEPDSMVVSIKSNEVKRINITLMPVSGKIDEVSVISSHKRFGNIERINHKDIEFVPDASGSFESILKSLPGVSSAHEMSSQYSVRGGNFDENLVYVNDIEIYRPFLIRSGQQEGLSFINSDMVEGVEFSAGGFNAEYGDKMSSVLSIRYRTPTKNTAGTEVSFMGANGTVEGVGANGKFTHLTGIRYKTSKYLLTTLDEGGDYTPSFIDFQTNLAWRFNPKFRMSFLGNFSSNSYQFVPQVRETRFGSFTNALQLKVFYQGQELNRFETIQGAITADYRPNEETILKFISSNYSATESETFDISGEYLLNELDNTLGSNTYGDSLINVGLGGFMNHARNFLDANFFRLEHRGSHVTKTNRIKWGVRFQYESINDRISEWELIDSSGYAVPYDGNELILPYHLKSQLELSSQRFSGFIQNSHTKQLNSWELTTTAGVRFSYWTFNSKWNVSPRATLMIKPNWNRDIAFHISGGYYHQPPIYKEYRKPDGTLNTNIKAQESLHAVFGVEYLFSAWKRPFRFQAELYHKEMNNLVPYKIDNVRVKYSGENIARGYAQGVDFKINGEFVPGAESWASISFMRTYEDIKNDSFINENGNVEYPGYYPRPTDQRFSVGAFFQDYLPGNPTYRVHLTGYYGTGLPFSMPNSPRYDLVARMPSYKRVDIGFTKVFKDESNSENGQLANVLWLKSLWVGVEIFNLFDFRNTISYLWVQTVSNQNNESGKYAVPNYLTSRRINVKITAKF
ncbi:MAG: TonB-dependent receptor [Bacteroidales bacterium]